MARAKSGGGLHGNKVVRPTPVAGKDNRAINPGGADGLGQHGRNIPPLEGGPGYKPNVSDGNYKAWNCPQGPGGGRTVYPSGYQDQHGSVRQAEHNPSPHTPGTRGHKAGPLG